MKCQKLEMESFEKYVSEQIDLKWLSTVKNQGQPLQIFWSLKNCTI